MSWREHHSKSERFSSKAELALKSGDKVKARELYSLAAEEEMKALETLDKSKTRTLGITAVSTASLWFKAQEHRQVERVICAWLATDILPDFAISELPNIDEKDGRTRHAKGLPEGWAAQDRMARSEAYVLLAPGHAGGSAQGDPGACGASAHHYNHEVHAPCAVATSRGRGPPGQEENRRKIYRV